MKVMMKRFGKLLTGALALVVVLLAVPAAAAEVDREDVYLWGFHLGQPYDEIKDQLKLFDSATDIACGGKRFDRKATFNYETATYPYELSVAIDVSGHVSVVGMVFYTHQSHDEGTTLCEYLCGLFEAQGLEESDWSAEIEGFWTCGYPARSDLFSVVHHPAAGTVGAFMARSSPEGEPAEPTAMPHSEEGLSQVRITGFGALTFGTEKNVVLNNLPFGLLRYSYVDRSQDTALRGDESFWYSVPFSKWGMLPGSSDKRFSFGVCFFHGRLQVVGVTITRKYLTGKDEDTIHEQLKAKYGSDPLVTEGPQKDMGLKAGETQVEWSDDEGNVLWLLLSDDHVLLMYRSARWNEQIEGAISVKGRAIDPLI